MTLNFSRHGDFVSLPKTKKHSVQAGLGKKCPRPGKDRLKSWIPKVTWVGVFAHFPHLLREVSPKFFPPGPIGACAVLKDRFGLGGGAWGWGVKHLETSQYWNNTNIDIVVNELLYSACFCSSEVWGNLPY